MSRVLRTAVMWLLSLALPLQGYAAATMAHCDASHHRMAGGLSHADAAPHDRAGHHHEVTSTAGAGVVKSVDSDSHHGGSATGDVDKLSKYKCSACASCCTSAVLPSSVVTFSTDSPVAFVAQPPAHGGRVLHRRSRATAASPPRLMRPSTRGERISRSPGRIR